MQLRIHIDELTLPDSLARDQLRRQLALAIGEHLHGGMSAQIGSQPSQEPARLADVVASAISNRLGSVQARGTQPTS